jgi:hypothetical protein
MQAPPLVWDDSIAATAQAWSDNCVFAHKGGTGNGENLAWVSDPSPLPSSPISSPPPPRQALTPDSSLSQNYPSTIAAIDAFYSEGANYQYGLANPPDFGAVGHFTQLVWVASQRLGVGSTVCNGNLFQVFMYNPPGRDSDG